ncbi:hypothetical protein OAX78_01135 [Planctomycetota bacterium]|nr:hypothetical protein [Planctomycetota bacterium]
MQRARAGVLALVFLFAAAPTLLAQDDRAFNTTFDGCEELPNGDRMLVVERGTSRYLMSAASYARNRGLILFLRSGEPIHVTLSEGAVAAVERGHKEETAPVEPDPIEPDPLEPDLLEPDPLEAPPDTLATAETQVGDTVRVGTALGQITDLRDDGYTLRPWSDGSWGEVTSHGRPEQAAVEPTWLSARSSTQVAGAEVTVAYRWQRTATWVPLEAEVSHATEHVLAFDLILDLETWPLEVGATSPVGEESEAVPPLVGGKAHAISRLLPSDISGSVSVHLRPGAGRAVSVTEPEAKPVLVGMLRSATELDDVRRATVMAAANGDPQLVAFLVTRASNDDAARAPVVEALSAHTPNLDGVVAGLCGPDRAVPMTVIAAGALTLRSARDAESGRRVKTTTLGLLGDLPGTLSAEAVGKLFDHQLAEAHFRAEIRTALRAHGAACVEALLDDATALPGGGASDQARSSAAVAFLLELGDAVGEALVAEAQARGVAVEAGSTPQAVLEALCRHRLVARSQALSAEVGAIAEQEPQAAVDTLRAVLTELPDHADAAAALPGALVRLGQAEHGEDRRGEAVLLYEEALEHVAPGQHPATRAVLAELYLEAAAEELGSVVLRAQPHDAGTFVRAAAYGELFPATGEVHDGWAQVALDEEGTTAWIRRRATRAAGETLQVDAEVTPFMIVEALLTVARDRAPDHADRVDALRGALFAREAEDKYLRGNYEGALADLEQVAVLAPMEPRLNLRTICWVNANMALLGTAIALILAIVGFVLYERNAKGPTMKAGDLTSQPGLVMEDTRGLPKMAPLNDTRGLPKQKLSDTQGLPKQKLNDTQGLPKMAGKGPSQQTKQIAKLAFAAGWGIFLLVVFAKAAHMFYRTFVAG